MPYLCPQHAPFTEVSRPHPRGAPHGKETSKTHIKNFNQNKQTTMVRRMKTAGILLASAMLATISLTTSCTDYDNGFDEATIRYNQNFKEIFGKIDPNQDWNLVRQLAEKNGGGV